MKVLNRLKDSSVDVAQVLSLLGGVWNPQSKESLNRNEDGCKIDGKQELIILLKVSVVFSRLPSVRKTIYSSY